MKIDRNELIRRLLSGVTTGSPNAVLANRKKLDVFKLYLLIK